MLSQNIFTLINIDDYEATPRYIQLANSILKAIEMGHISKGYWLPSLNELSDELDISRDTADKVYKRLRTLGVASSVRGKGVFISSVFVIPPLKICLIFDKLSSHKKIIYDAFVASVAGRAIIDFYIYNNDTALFKKLLKKAGKGYSDHVIIPPHAGPDEDVASMINEIPMNNLLLVRQLVSGLSREYSAVYEDFERDLFSALEQALERLANYHTLKIIVPSEIYYPQGITDGFINFCRQYAFEYGIISDGRTIGLSKGEVYICLVEDDLVFLVERLLGSGLLIGKDIGIISYNETPLKKFILDGITTISADFRSMGETAAALILNRETARIRAPFHLTLRNSL